MNKLSNIFKIIFHFLNIILIFFYLFPGNISGIMVAIIIYKIWKKV